jgi:hypothetical protein
LDLSRPVTFDKRGSYVCPDVPENEMLDPLPLALMRASGVPRARSVAKSTVFAALLGRDLLKQLATTIAYDGDRVGVAVASSSAIAPIAWEFESVGMKSGWSRTDTMLLPSSIPSAITTQTSAVFGTHASAISFQDGVLGACAAFEHIYLSFLHQRSDYFLFIGAEEVCHVQHRALRMLDGKRPLIDGAAGAVLSRQRLSPHDWQLRLMGHCFDDRSIVLPGEWSDVPVHCVTCDSHLTVYSSTLLPFLLHQAFSTGAKRVLINCRLPRRGVYVLGFARENCYGVR